jgi:sucrose-6-phosphate hydrolase SacC (GH32 family)
MHVFVDGSVIEAFINGGTAAVTSRVYPTASDAVSVGVYACAGNGSPVHLLNATVWTMGSIWISEDAVLAERERRLGAGQAS